MMGETTALKCGFPTVRDGGKSVAGPASHWAAGCGKLLWLILCHGGMALAEANEPAGPAAPSTPTEAAELTGVNAPEPKFPTDTMTDEELIKFRDEQIARLQKLARETQPEKTGEGTAYQVFYCTIYYTPKESGFTAERGFDVTPTTAPGLSGRTYPKSFLAAVKKEGFGRLVEPVGERNYLQYVGSGRYQFARAPLGRRGNVLVPRKTCAVSRRNPHLRQNGKLTIVSPTVQAVMGSDQWIIEDTGGGIHPLQIDLYWGEDEPRGGVGRNVARPSGTAMEYAFDAVVIAR